MFKSSTRCVWWGPALVLALLLTPTAQAAGTWVQLTPDGNLTVKDAAAAQGAQFRVLGYDENAVRVLVDAPGVTVEPQKTAGGEFVVITWPGSKPSGEIGAPALPVVRHLLISRPGAVASLTTTIGATAVIDGATAGFPLQAMPRQRPVPKTPGAIQNAPFDFDAAAYAVDMDYLAEPATIERLGIVRGQQLFLLEVRPVAYNPATETITLRSQIDVEITFTGGEQSDLSPSPGLDRIVLNPGGPVEARGSGNYLIVVPTTFETQIASFASAKTAQGFSVATHAVPDGTANSTIKTYIEGLWGGPDAPEYILLIGDTNLIPHWVGGGDGTPDTDIQYGCMDGSGDWYPDIAIGRFPARTTTHLNTLMDKTLYYENGPLADPDYLKRAVFMASVDNYSITEGTHNYVIDTWLAPNGYQCDKLYQVTYGADTQDVRDSFNDGRFYGIYSGHGGTTSWGDGPPFSQSDVNGLTNADMYSFICSFACITGDYVYGECFMETWVLAPDKAAVCSWGSSVNSYWDEDDILERVLFDAIFDTGDTVKTEAGPIYNEAKMRLLDHYGATSTIRRYFEMYNLMGDPSLTMSITCPDAGTIGLDESVYGCESTAAMTVSDCGLNLDDGVIDTVDVTIDSDSEPAGEIVTLYETDTDSAQFQGSIALSVTNAAGVLRVAWGDTVTATYIDADDGQGGTNVVVTAIATVDCTPGPEVVYSFPLDTNPGWSTQDQWAWGQPAGSGGAYGNPDPTSGHTGSNAYGYNLSGDYANSMSEQHLTSTAIDCTDLTNVELRFWRWLNVETAEYDHASVEVSNNGTNWTLLWENPDGYGNHTEDSSWSQQAFDISGVADGEPTVYVRWVMGTTDGSWTFSGWNVDDIEIWANAPPEGCPNAGGSGQYCVTDIYPNNGDGAWDYADDGDCVVDMGDLGELLANYGMTSGATREHGDVYPAGAGDGAVDMSDLGELLPQYGDDCN